MADLLRFQWLPRSGRVTVNSIDGPSTVLASGDGRPWPNPPPSRQRRALGRLDFYESSDDSNKTRSSYIRILTFNQSGQSLPLRLRVTPSHGTSHSDGQSPSPTTKENKDRITNKRLLWTLPVLVSISNPPEEYIGWGRTTGEGFNDDMGRD